LGLVLFYFIEWLSLVLFMLKFGSTQWSNPPNKHQHTYTCILCCYSK